MHVLKNDTTNNFFFQFILFYTLLTFMTIQCKGQHYSLKLPEFTTFGTDLSSPDMVFTTHSASVCAGKCLRSQCLSYKYEGIYSTIEL